MHPVEIENLYRYAEMIEENTITEDDLSEEEKIIFNADEMSTETI